MSVRLTNHIAYRFLNDETIIWEIMEMVYPEILRISKNDDLKDHITPEMAGTYKMITPEGNKSFYITDSVIKNLDLLKVKRNAEGQYDYTIFSSLKPQKCTFITPDNRLVRLFIPEGEASFQMLFDYIRYVPDKEKKYYGHMNNCMFYVNRVTGEQCSHFAHPDVKEVEDLLYRLLCFIYLSETEEMILKPGEKMGTKKSGKLINEIKQPLIVVTSKWNITSVRTEGFKVSGHFRLQPHGEGRKQVRVQWIDPFEKEGYIRTAKKDLV